jgi:hypothetical protein
MEWLDQVEDGSAKHSVEDRVRSPVRLEMNGRCLDNNIFDLTFSLSG